MYVCFATEITQQIRKPNDMLKELVRWREKEKRKAKKELARDSPRRPKLSGVDK